MTIISNLLVLFDKSGAVYNGETQIGVLGESTLTIYTSPSTTVDYARIGNYILNSETVIGTINGDKLVMKNGETDDYTTASGYLLQGTTPVSPIGTMEQSGMSISTFVISSFSTSFAVKETTGTTNLNFYIFNGMAIVVELYNVEK